MRDIHLRSSNTGNRKILIVAPLMHQLGHYSVFPLEMAAGFAMNGVSVSVLHPFPAKVASLRLSDIRTICLADEAGTFTGLMKLVWRRLSAKPILLCLAWLIIHVRPNTYDLVYWADFKPDNQRSMWALGLASVVGLYRHRTAFTEHHNFSWNKHRWQRLFRLDRIRLRHIEMFVHSRKLLDWIRLNMSWPEAGHYVPHGLWPDPASDSDRIKAREVLSIASNARVLLIFGMQAIRRKEIDTLAEAVRALSLEQPLVLLFAGMKVNDELHPFEHSDLTAKNNLHISYYESFIPNESVKLFFSAADAVWAYYGSFIGASGVLAQSIAFGRLSICSDSGEIGELSRQYPIGLVAPTGDLDGLKFVISRFLSLPIIEQEMFEAAAREAANEMAWPNITRQILNMVMSDSKDNKNLTGTGND